MGTNQPTMVWLKSMFVYLDGRWESCILTVHNQVFWSLYVVVAGQQALVFSSTVACDTSQNVGVLVFHSHFLALMTNRTQAENKRKIVCVFHNVLLLTSMGIRRYIWIRRGDSERWKRFREGKKPKGRRRKRERDGHRQRGRERKEQKMQGRKSTEGRKRECGP